MALTYTPTEPAIGSLCPEFNLPAVDGRAYSRNDFFGKPMLVMFICNHCPYVKAIEDRLISLGHDLAALGVATVGICSNDPVTYPDDSFENLKIRWSDKKYSFPYLHDLSQNVAKTFGAVCTPDFFLYDSNHKLYYRGRLDDSWKDPAHVTRRELFLAAKAMVEKSQLEFAPKPSMGCSINWVKA